MSLSEEHLRLGEERKLIFINFCNLVPKEMLAVYFARSVNEIEREIAFVARKITEYRHRRCAQPAGLADWQTYEPYREWQAKYAKVPEHRRPWRRFHKTMPPRKACCRRSSAIRKTT